jgi:alkaline phosphatase D
MSKVSLKHIVIVLVIAVFSQWTSPVWGKRPLVTPAATPVLGELDPYLIETLYNSKDPDASLANVQDDAAFAALVKKHNLHLFGGPMLGCVRPTSARIWVRTVRPSRVRIVASREASLASPVRSEESTTSADRDFTAVLGIESLEPFTQYHYQVLVNDRPVLEEPLPVFRTSPRRDQKAKFSVGFGGGARYVSEKERIWDTIAALHPQAFLFLGDNIYIDEPQWRGKQRSMYYRRQLRPEFRRLVSQTAIYAIWDDHDFGKNDVAGGLDPFQPAWKVPAWKVFCENWNNPYYGGGAEQPGCWFDFSIGDVDFFMTDGRYYRSFKDGTMLGPAQKRWLLDRLKASTATFKVIASGTLWTEHADKGGRDSWWGVPKEREEIFSLIDRQKIAGVVLLSADRHRTDIYRIERSSGYDLYEFETSKLTNNHTHGTKSEALFSYNEGNFFGLLRFDLTPPDPTVTFECVTIDSKVVHQFPLRRSQLVAKPSR